MTAIAELQQERIETAPATMTGAEVVCEALVREGVDTLFGYPGGAVLHLYDPAHADARPPPPHPRAPRTGRRAHGRGLRESDGQDGRGAGDVGAGRNERGHRNRERVHGLHAARRHHRPGAAQDDRHRRVPGSRHRRHHAAVHEDELPRPSRRRAGGRDPRSVSSREQRPSRSRARRHPERRHRGIDAATRIRTSASARLRSG